MIKRLWFRGLARARIYRRLILVERPLSQPFPDVSASVPVSVSLLAAGEIDAYMAFRPDQSVGEVRRRLDEGQQCFAVWHDRRIIHAAWAATGRARIEYLSAEIALAPDEVYVYEVFTSPAFRGRSAAPTRVLKTVRYFRDRSYRRLLAAILPENRSSLHLGEKVGWDRIGVIGYVGFGPWRHVFCRIDRSASAQVRAFALGRTRAESRH
jgi:GNAT superfamily N-acetyltransferase